MSHLPEQAVDGGKILERVRYRKEELLALADAICPDFWGGIDADTAQEIWEQDREQPGASVVPPRKRNVDRRQRISKHLAAAPGVIWYLEKESDGYEPVVEHDMEEEAAGESESDDFESFQPRAFVVDGEPDFESGPPQDGWEYLRRVSWEAALCPQLKVAKIDARKLAAPQTAYMPCIPPVECCAPQLLPLPEWETQFVADFSELRLKMCSTQALFAAKSSLPSVRNKAAWQALCFGTNPGVRGSGEDEGRFMGEEEEVEEGMKDTEDDGLDREEVERSEMDSQGELNDVETFSVEGEAEDLKEQEASPQLSIVCRLDSRSRAALFRNHVSWLENVTGLPQNRALWLFSLAAVLDKPLDADTAAAFRALLRRCAKIRACKSCPDEELVMLNMLITIAGRCFGQADSTSEG